MIITKEQYVKIDLVDKLLDAMSVEQLKELTESAQLVAVLKGTASNPGLLRELIQENTLLSMEMVTLRNELYSIKEDVKALLRVVNQVVFAPPPYNNDFQNLRSKYYI
jgi:regulator of replication initiation timing